MKHPVFFALGVGFYVWSTVIYARAIRRSLRSARAGDGGGVRPHLFSWLLWGTTMGIAGAAQIASGGGTPAAILLLLGSLSCLLISTACLWIGEKRVTPTDWAAFLLALGAIPLWMATRQPFWSVLLVTGIDSCGYIPTFRKSWDAPHQENAGTFAVGVPSLLCTILSLDSFSLVNWLYPATICSLNGLLAATLIVRRAIKDRKPSCSS